jgi:hypothetical protein
LLGLIRSADWHCDPRPPIVGIDDHRANTHAGGQLGG